MSQRRNCELTHKRGARKITRSVFIKPALEKERAFFVSPGQNVAIRRVLCKEPINRCDAQVKVINPNCRERATWSTENPKIFPRNSNYKISKESEFLNNKWRFGGGIIPREKPSTRCALQFLQGFFYRLSRSSNPHQPLSPQKTHQNN